MTTTMMMNAFFRVFLTIFALYYYISRHVLITGRTASELASVFAMVSGVGGIYVP